VQHYANFAAFPWTGDEDVLYVDDAADIVYVWDSTTAAYVNASGTGAGLFSITDGTTSQSIGVGNTLSFLDANLIKAEVSATDTLTIGIDTTGATTGQVPSYNGTNVVWSTPTSTNIYTADGALAWYRQVDLNGNQLEFNDWTNDNQIILEMDWTSGTPILSLNHTGIAWPLTMYSDAVQHYILSWAWLNITGTDATTLNSDATLALNAQDELTLSSAAQDYRLVTAPTTATTQTVALVRDATTGRLYLKDLATLSTARYVNTWTPTANVETVHTHALSAWEDIQIQVRDSVTKEIVDVEIRIISATTFGVTSTTVDPLRVIAL
jgi:hypothetical protein